MELLGDRNWWLPGWLGRILPTVQFEGGIEDAPAPGHPRQREIAQAPGK
jgi:RND superfamily putative drug exporter